MPETLHGVIDGDSIKLSRPSAFPTGTAVRIVVIQETPMGGEQRVPGEGLKAAFGAWKGDDEQGLDEYLEPCRESRRQSSSRDLGL